MPTIQPDLDVTPAGQPRRANRAFDLALGLIGLVVAAPFVAGAALAIRASGDRGPLLYRARRVGEDGRTITVHKLRTMRVATTGPGITGSDDDRITPIGRLLRRSKIDELPQFFDVVRGAMSVVGPRPEDPRYIDWSDPIHRFVFSARPGITGPSQIMFRHEEQLLAGQDPERAYRTEVLPRKVRLDADYLRRRTVATDLAIVGATIRAIVDRD